jgi:TonB family protein
MEAQTKGTQGRVICAFDVNEDGSISDIEVIRGVDPLLDAEAVRVLGTMPKWTPGKNKGEVVAVRYTVPITFLGYPRSKPSSKLPENPIYDNSDPTNPVYRVADVMPQFPGGDGELLSFLAKSIKYPKEAQTKKLQGRVVCAFTVNKDGSISEMEVVKKVDPLLDAEAVRVIDLMPKWTPGKEKGKPVRVRYTVPVTFRLQ